MKSRSQKKDKQILITIAIIVLLFILATDGRLLIRGQEIIIPPEEGVSEGSPVAPVATGESNRETLDRLRKEIEKLSKALEQGRETLRATIEKSEKKQNIVGEGGWLLLGPNLSKAEKLLTFVNNAAIKILEDLNSDNSFDSGVLILDKDGWVIHNPESPTKGLILNIHFSDMNGLKKYNESKRVKDYPRLRIYIKPEIVAVTARIRGRTQSTIPAWRTWFHEGSEDEFFDKNGNITRKLAGAILEELTHALIPYALADMTGIDSRKADIPVWFNEGVANGYQHEGITGIHEETMRNDVAEGKLPSIDVVLNEQINRPFQFLVNDRLSYSTGYHFVRFLKEKLKMKNPLDLLANYIIHFYDNNPIEKPINYNEADWNKVIKLTFGNQNINNEKDLEEAFHKWLKEKY